MAYRLASAFDLIPNTVYRDSDFFFFQRSYLM